VYKKKKNKTATVTEFRKIGKRRKETKKEDTMWRCRRGTLPQGEYERAEDCQG
jgi:hypothetical protein